MGRSAVANESFTDEVPDGYDERQLAMARLLHIPYSPQRPTVKQARFLLDFQREALFGGAAGGGKSSALLMAALQFIDVPGYAAILFRRSYSDLSQPGALMDRAREWFAPFKPEVRWSEIEHKWTFPSGATINFAYIDKQNDHLKYQGAEFQFCVAKGTPILMADNTWTPIEDVAVGDSVMTMEGPRRVTATHQPGVKPVARVVTPTGTTLISMDHRVFTGSSWVAPRELIARRHPTCYTSSAKSLASPRVQQQTTVLIASGQQQVLEPVRRLPVSLSLVGCASSGDGRTGSGVSDDSPRGTPQPEVWCGPLVLFGPVPRSGPPASVDAERDAPMRSGIEGSTVGCRPCARCDDGLPHGTPAGDPACIPSPDDAEARTHRTPSDGRGCTPRRSRPGALYCHPYSSTERPVTQDVHQAYVAMAPAGVAEVVDLTIEDASHYVAWGGIIAANCGFDELTQFKEKQYRYLFSRLRKTEETDDPEKPNPLSRVPLRVRSGTNPGGPGHHWVYLRFVKSWEDWMRRRAQWESYEPVERAVLELVDPGPAPRPHFHPSTIDDNPHLNSDDYDLSLDQLDLVTKAQLRQGDWQIKPDGRMFKRTWFKDIVGPNDIPTDCRWVRWWDLAATEEDADLDPDWTAGCLMGLSPQGIIFVRHMMRLRAEAHDVQSAVKQAAAADGFDIPVGMEQEPGSSGKSVVSDYRRIHLQGYQFHSNPSSGSKIERAKPFAGRAGKGDVKLVAGAWISDFLDELEIFPDGEHDDQVDAASAAYLYLSRGLGALNGLADGGVTELKIPDMSTPASQWSGGDYGYGWADAA